MRLRRKGPKLALNGSALPLTAVVALLVLSGCVGADRGGVSVGDHLPAFSLLNWDERRISPESLRGKRSVIAFTYAKCELACPLITAQLKTLDEKIGSPPDIAYLHISVNPADDTPAVIRKHFSDHGIDPEKDTRWLFAHGGAEDIRRLLAKFEIHVEKKPVGEAFLIEHTIKVWVTDRAGQLVASFDTYVWDGTEMMYALGS